MLAALERHGVTVHGDERVRAVDPGLRETAAAEPTLDEFITRRAEDLKAYQDGNLAARYLSLVAQARQAGERAQDTDARFVRTVARTAYRLMAYKDEYEVARLYTQPEFRAALEAQFSGRKMISVWLSPPLISRVDPVSGRPQKRRFGPWVFHVFAALARLKGLRGTAFDPFGRTEERRMERRLASGYATLVAELCAKLTPARLEASIKLVGAPDEIRGFGPVKAKAHNEVVARMQAMKTDLDNATLPLLAAVA